jgi:hypothetical protein
MRLEHEYFALGLSRVESVFRIVEHGWLLCVLMVAALAVRRILVLVSPMWHSMGLAVGLWSVHVPRGKRHRLVVLHKARLRGASVFTGRATSAGHDLLHDTEEPLQTYDGSERQSRGARAMTRRYAAFSRAL